MGDFVHLHVHSEYSLLDGMGSPEALHRAAAAHGQPALAITDHGNVFATVKHLGMDSGVKPIVGCELYVGPNSDHLIVLAKNMAGIQSLNTIVSKSNIYGFYKKPLASKEMLEEHRQGLMVLSGCVGSELGKAIRTGRGAEDVVHWYKERFGDDYWLEVQDHGLASEALVGNWVAKNAQALGVKVVATQDSHFVSPEDAHAHELLLAVQTHSTWDSPKRFRFDGDGYWLASTPEMEARFPIEWTRETMSVMERVAYEPIHKGGAKLPWPHGVPQGADLGDWLANKVMASGRYDAQVHAAQVAHEIGVIVATGYERYFLIVSGLCDWARARGIRTSARGSAAGSLVAYCLGITPVDPVKYRLSFERFLNEGRTPDIDLDFEDARRHEVIEFARNAYGANHVAPIITFAQIGGRMAVRDVGRVMQAPIYEVNEICAKIPFGKSLADAGFDKEALKSEVLQGALALEGAVRHAGKHAAGVVISSEPLMETCGLVRDNSGPGSLPIAGLEMGDLERIGLVKFDLLGLKTLSVVGETIRRIGYTPDFEDGDEDAYRLLAQGKSVGVFQVESSGMRAVLRELKPTKIEHLQAIVALYRPGPLEHIGSYVRRKNGMEAEEYYSPHFKEVLGDTYGLLVYQEAIMDIAHKIAGMTPYESDQFLGAVRKKDPKKLVIYEPKFRDGLARAGVPQNAIDAVWRDILPFANYGFNKAHAACYGKLAYETAWLKAKEPEAYFASLMDAERGDVARISALVIDARRMGLRVLPPCVNKSVRTFSHEPGVVRYGMEGIKYGGPRAIEAIIGARAGGPFQSLEDFLRRVPKKDCNKRVVTYLAFAGAFDELANRRVVLGALGARGDTLMERLEGEREAIGMALSHDILTAFDLDGAGRDMMSSQLAEAAESGLGWQVTMAGEIMQKRSLITRNGKPMVRLVARDEDGEYDVVLFAEAAERLGPTLAEGKVVLFQGKPNAWQGSASLVATAARAA